MKRIYLVKKDPLMPPAEDNWIYMNQYEFIDFMNTPAGKRRKENFGQLDAIDEGDVIYIVECENKLAKQLRKDKNNSDYLREFEKNITLLSLDTPEDEANDADDRDYLDKVFLSEEDLTKETLLKLDIEKLRIAINSLDDEEKWIIQKLFFDERTISARELSEMMNIPQKTLHYRKTQIFKKIRKNF